MPRWMHHVYAYLMGYFWIPCPLCGRIFGGHEDNGMLWIEQGEDFTWAKGKSVCSLHPGDHFAEGVRPWKSVVVA